MVVHTKAAGRTSIKVTVRHMNSSSGQFEGNLLELSDEVQIDPLPAQRWGRWRRIWVFVCTHARVNEP